MKRENLILILGIENHHHYQSNIYQPAIKKLSVNYFLFTNLQFQQRSAMLLGNI